MIYHYQNRALKIPDKTIEDYEYWTGGTLTDDLVTHYINNQYRDIYGNWTTNVDDLSDDALSDMIIGRMNRVVASYNGALLKESGNLDRYLR